MIPEKIESIIEDLNKADVLMLLLKEKIEDTEYLTDATTSLIPSQCLYLAECIRKLLSSSIEDLYSAMWEEDKPIHQLLKGGVFECPECKKRRELEPISIAKLMADFIDDDCCNNCQDHEKKEDRKIVKLKYVGPLKAEGSKV